MQQFLDESGVKQVWDYALQYVPYQSIDTDTLDLVLYESNKHIIASFDSATVTTQIDNPGIVLDDQYYLDNINTNDYIKLTITEIQEPCSIGNLNYYQSDYIVETTSNTYLQDSSNNPIPFNSDPESDRKNLVYSINNSITLEENKTYYLKYVLYYIDISPTPFIQQLISEYGWLIVKVI